jgi:FKBP-type peptidyl-prolyl cis-trans isomerase
MRDMRRRLVLLGLAALSVAPAFAADDPLSAAANTAFLAANARKSGTVIRPSGLQYRIQRNGTGKRPGGGDVVRLGYAIRLINGTLVDSTTPVLPAALAMGSLAMAGLAEALALMHEGDRWQLVIPANLAFGDKGAMNGTIPPNQTLVMDLTLVSAAPPEPGQSVTESPFSVWSNGRENGATFTIRP